MIRVGDCRVVLPMLPAESVDSIVTDPPYELDFMGRAWDRTGVAFDVATWREALRVAKPGAYLVAFGGTRTFHRMMVAVEDAGWEIRDTLMWCYGQGFPKSRDVAKAIDQARHGGLADVYRVTGWIRERCGELGLRASDLNRAAGVEGMASHWMTSASQPAIPTLEQWRKLEPLLGPAPAWMVPLLLPALQVGEAYRSAEVIGHQPKDAPGAGWRRTVTGEGGPSDRAIRALSAEAAAWKGWGTALKPAWEPIVLARKPFVGGIADVVREHGTGALNIDGCRVEFAGGADEAETKTKNAHAARGAGARKNAVFGEDGRDRTDYNAPGRWPANLVHDGSDDVVECFPNEGGASTARFFYCAKPAPDERHDGVDENPHPTVKPTALMRWLVRLVTPTRGCVLDPFTGSGTTGRAALAEGMTFQGIELDAGHAALAEARIRVVQPGLGL